jgi:flagellar protein FlaJ
VIGPLLPLLLVAVLALPVLFSPVSPRANLLLSRLAVPIFGDYVGRSSRRNWQLERLRATHVGTTHRVFASRTLLISGIAGVVGAILGVYVAVWLVDLFSISRESILGAVPPALSFLAGLTRLQDLTLLGLFVLFLFFGATVGTTLALGTYWARWTYLDQLSNARASEIEATLPRTIAFVYALSRSGMPFPKVLDTLARNDAIYGEAAREIGVVVRDMEAFSTDILTAIERTADRTPSEGLSEFADNLSSVLGSGRNLSAFLRDQYERYQEEAEAQQEQYLELVATLAEVYVTVLVAGPLFFITVLVVIGLVIEDTITIVRIVGYAGIPLASAGFVVYIDSLTQHETALTDVSRDVGDVIGTSGDGVAGSGSPRPDGGTTVDGAAWRHNAERLAAYDRLRALRSWLNDPLRSVLERPWISFVVTVPLGVAWVLYRAVPIPLGPSALGVLDLPTIEAAIFVMTVFAVLHEVHKRRVRVIERAVPDFLERLASVNEAGMSVVESLKRVADTDLGGLDAEVDRTWQDVRWGADVATAFRRLAARTRVRMVAQAVTLITNAMSASGDIAPVLRIAADEAQATRRLRRERRQEMLTYILVIYISVFVFIGIIAALTVAFIPAVQDAGAGGAAATPGSTPGSGIAGAFTGTDVDAEAYELLFFHISALQAVCSGLIAGQLAEGGIADGVKHATGLLVLTYLTFAFVLL